MLKKGHFFIVTIAWNAALFWLCDYWQQTYAASDLGVGLAAGIIAVIVIALGEASVIQQIYMMAKCKKQKMQVFEYRLFKQILILVLFHVALIAIKSNLINIQGVFYIAAIGIFLSMGWLKGSEILWTSEEKSYYLIGNGKIYNVENIMENTKVFELSCTRKGERDRVITIEKKDAIDEQSRLKSNGE